MPSSMKAPNFQKVKKNCSQHLKVGKRGTIVKNVETLVLLHVWVNLLVCFQLLN